MGKNYKIWIPDTVDEFFYEMIKLLGTGFEVPDRAYN